MTIVREVLDRLTSESLLSDLPMTCYQVEPGTRVATVSEEFHRNPALPGVIVGDGEHLLGVVSRTKFLRHLSQPFGLELYMKRPIRVLLDAAGESYLVLTADTEIRLAAQSALGGHRSSSMSRSSSRTRTGGCGCWKSMFCCSRSRGCSNWRTSLSISRKKLPTPPISPRANSWRI